MRPRGSIIIFSYLVIAFLILWQATGFRRSAVELNASERFVDTHQAFHLAEAGASRAVQWLRGQPSPPAGTAAFDPFGGPQALGDGTYTAVVDPDDDNPTSYLDLYTITVTAQLTGGTVTRQIAQVLRTESFARYSYFTNSEELWGTWNIWFTSRDHLTGPVHSNDQFNIAGSPIFDGMLTSGAASINYQNPPPAGGNNPAFNGGLTLNAPSVTMPLSAAQLRIAAAGGGQWYEGNTTIVLLSDGTMRVTNPASGMVNQLVPLPVNGALFVNGGNATVSGTLNGQLSIGSSEDIRIADNILYDQSPLVNPASDDVLGLVAEENVIVSSSAPYDVTVHGSIMAIDNPSTSTPYDGSFTVERWWVGPAKGTLRVLGGIIQGERGPVGTFYSGSGQKRSGFTKDYIYDDRLSSMAPPFFPTTGDYEDVMWQEK